MLTRFDEGMYYVMSPPGTSWSHYDGPFETKQDAIDFLRQFVNNERTHSPEMLDMVVSHFKDDKLHMVKENDKPLNGHYLLGEL